MQFVRTAELKPGMRLAKPIYNKRGVLLYERGTRLTAQGIESIKNFGLIGIFTLEPAEPLPPLSKEDLEFEQFQTVYVFQLKENLDKIQAETAPDTLKELAVSILNRYGSRDSKMNFTQNLRSSADFVYKHSISTAILTAMLCNALHVAPECRIGLVTAALLMDIGYLYVPQAILDKGDNLSADEKDFIQSNLERGYEALRPRYNDYHLPQDTLELIHYKVFSGSHTLKLKDSPKISRVLIEILRVGDKFDRLTAMDISHPPISEIAAMNYFTEHKKEYNAKVVSALAECIHILPTGACVDLSDGEKALVLSENAADFSHPMILRFRDHRVFDLSDLETVQQFHITDIMRTMDNRIAIDADTLKQFKADKHLLETMERFRKSKERIASRNRSLDSVIDLNAFAFDGFDDVKSPSDL